MMRILFSIYCTLAFISPSFGQETKEDFDSFFFQFATEKEFQRERIKFPLEYVTWENEEDAGGKIITTKITKDEWKHDYFYMNENYRPQIFDNFEGTLRDTDERLFQWIGTETGVDVKYYFKRIDGKWYLVKKEDLGD
jgi:Domain of unknown function (DUF4348)